MNNQELTDKVMKKAKKKFDAFLHEDRTTESVVIFDYPSYYNRDNFFEQIVNETDYLAGEEVRNLMRNNGYKGDYFVNKFVVTV